MTDGLKESTGVDLTAVLSGFLGGTVAKDSNTKTSDESNEKNDNAADTNRFNEVTTTIR